MSARARLAALLTALMDAPDDADPAAIIAAHPGGADDALAYLRGRFVDDEGEVEWWESSGATERVLAALLVRGGAAAARELVVIALAVGHPGHLRLLADLLRAVVPPDQLADELLEALRGGPAVRRLADEVAYHTFDAAGEDYAARPALAAALATARGRGAAPAGPRRDRDRA